MRATNAQQRPTNCPLTAINGLCQTPAGRVRVAGDDLRVAFPEAHFSPHWTQSNKPMVAIDHDGLDYESQRPRRRTSADR
jgi:hypothetical protein